MHSPTHRFKTVIITLVVVLIGCAQGARGRPAISPGGGGQAAALLGSVITGGNDFTILTSRTVNGIGLTAAPRESGVSSGVAATGQTVTSDGDEFTYSLEISSVDLTLDVPGDSDAELIRQVAAMLILTSSDMEEPHPHVENHHLAWGKVEFQSVVQSNGLHLDDPGQCLGDDVWTTGAVKLQLHPHQEMESSPSLQPPASVGAAAVPLRH